MIVISTYPPKGSTHGNRFSAVASYTKNTLDAIDRNNNEPLDIIVLADILDKKENYQEGKRRIFRIWNRNSFAIYPKIFFHIIRFLNHRKILFEFEFGMFGGNKVLIGLFPLFILILRLFGRKVYTVSHGVILKSSEVSEQLGTGSTANRIYDSLLSIIYFLILFFSTKVIVFEKYPATNLTLCTRFEIQSLIE